MKPEHTNVPAELITYGVDDVAAALGITPTHLRLLVRSGKVQARRFGRRIVFTHQELKDLVDGLPAAT